MARSSWLAKSCRTCIARKVKCDKNTPQCSRCQSSGRICGGYYQGLKPILPTREEQSLATHQRQTLVISQFLDDYLPPQTASSSVSRQSPVYWVETFYSFLDSQSTIVKASLSALTLTYLANSQRDDALAYSARHYYIQTTRYIRALRRIEHSSDLIHTCMILALYEVYSHPPSDENAWHIHVQAAYNFTRESDFQQQQALSKHDLRRLCTIEFLRVCISGQGMTTPRLDFQMQSSPDAFDGLLEILFRTTPLIGSLRQKRTNRTSASELLRTSAYSERELLTWFHELQSMTSPIFVDAPESMSETINFTNPSSIPLVVLYWLGMVAVYTSMTKALRALAQYTSPRSLQHRLERAETLSHRFANRISQCYAGCVGMGRGTNILVAATSSAAQRILRLDDQW